MRRLALVVLFSPLSVLAQTWCGKHYMSSQSILPPGGNFPLPSLSTDPLLALRCAPATQPYLKGDDSDYILIDTPVVLYHIANAQPITLKNDIVIDVKVTLDGRTLATGYVPLNATAWELPLNLTDITPQTAAYNLSCEATYADTQTFSATAALSLLPSPTNSSVTKMDLRTGALLAKPATGADGEYAPVFPIGFYTDFGYLASNLSVIDQLYEQGFTIIHPIPPFDDTTALNLVLDRMQQVGLYLMYDMRYTYMDLSSVTTQVNTIKHRANLLLWYTGDEPDGTSDPLNATTTTYDLIYTLDGYHPVSLVLNCQDYYWSDYTAGTDIVMQDVYMVGNNVTWSNEWNTTCTPDYGDCGCDNCVSIPAGDTAAVPPNSTYYGASNVPANSGVGSYFDISERVASFQNRLEVMGWERTKAVWTVPQAFGGSGYWLREPTGQEWVVQSLMGINQGALGIVPWSDPTSASIKTYSSALALALPELTPYLFDPYAVRKPYVVGGASVAMWGSPGKPTLVIAANTNYMNQSIEWSALGLVGSGAKAVFVSGDVEVGSGGVTLGAVASGAFVVST